MLWHSAIGAAGSSVPFVPTGISVIDHDQMYVSGVSGNQTEMTCPAGAQAGDLLILYGSCSSGSANTPSGWTVLGTDINAGNWSGHAVCKIADGTEGGNTFNAIGGSPPAGHHHAVLAVFRFSGTGVPTSLTVQDSNAQATSGNPSSFVLDPNDFTKPSLTWALYSSNLSVSTRTWTGSTEDGEDGFDNDGRSYMKWKFNADGDTPADVTVDMEDVSSANFLAGAVIEVA